MSQRTTTETLHSEQHKNKASSSIAPNERITKLETTPSTVKTTQGPNMKPPQTMGATTNNE